MKVVAMIAAILVLAYAGCTPVAGTGAQASCDGGDGTSGITGTVVLAPTCPVQQAGEPPCERPYPEARPQINKKLLNVQCIQAGCDLVPVCNITPAADGTFTVSLPPGVYAITQGDGGAGVPPTLAQLNFDVKPGQFTQLAVVYDSGIR